jgi:putative transcriptional regulator
MTKAFTKIMAGLEDARAHLEKRDDDRSVVHKIRVPKINVAAIRRTTGLSQAQFALSVGVPKGTLLNWEQGRRAPNGPARILLALIAKRPSIVQDLLNSAK